MDAKRERIWYNIPQYKGYQINKKGVVKSLKRKVWNGHAFIERPARILSAHPDGSGYPTVHICMEGKKENNSKHTQTFMYDF